ncbi:pentatricopeptide repeat (PPR) superfamily protein [Tasmannia lanceolata]|uniref:pentatricopeptide repeat (PPR) superfamily protein n=1 Tax=Tasmannia lanceolata TaxID=3420 RepID=UPI004063EE66
MPCYSSPVGAKIPFPSTTHLRFLLQSSSNSKPISSSSAPTHQDIARLILDQKSPSQAIQTFRWASKIPNFLHTQSTYRALIQKLCSFRRFHIVEKVLEEMPSSIGSTPDDDVFVTIVRGLGHARMPQQAIKIPNLMIHRYQKNPSLKIFNSVLDVLVREDIDLARDFFRKKMMGSGIQGDDYTFGILMKGLCWTNRIGEGFKLLSLMKSRGLEPNSVIYNTLIHALCRNGKVGRARSLINEMVDPSGVTFNVMISAYCREGDLIQALVMLEKSFALGFVPDVVTVTKVLEVLCNEGRVMDAVEVLDRVEKKKGGLIDTVAYNAVINGFCRLGKVKVGKRFLKEMEGKGCLPNVNTYNTLIAGFCESGNLDSALDLFHEMRTDGIDLNFVTYDTLIRGLCSGGRIADGFKILNMMEESRGGLGGRISLYNSIIYGLYRENRLEEAREFLVEMGRFFPRAVDKSLKILGFCEEGKVEEAKKVYDHMISEGGVPSALVFVRLIHGFCEEGNVREAFELMNEMVENSYFPIVSTFNALISGFCREGRVGGASKLIEEMVERGCLPNAGSYSSLIDVFCSRGDIQRAFGLLVKMVGKGIDPDHLIWNSLVLCLSQETVWMESKNRLQVNHLLDWICENQSRAE